MPPRRKAQRTEVVSSPHDAPEEEEDLGRVMCQLRDENGKPTGGQLVVPAGATVRQLDELLCSMLEGQDAKDVPYAFFLGNEQITTSLADLLLETQRDEWVDKQLKQGRRVRPGDREKVEFVPPEETVLGITYRPQAVFKVRAVSRCAAALDGHSEAVLVVAFSPDGKALATGSGDRTIRLWDMLTSTSIETLEAHRNWVQALSWSPDGATLASGSRDGGLVTWRHDNYSDFKPTQLKGHTNYLSHISWEPLHRNAKCDRFVTASKDTGLKVWRVGAGLVMSLSGHTSCVTCVKWGGNDTIYSTSQDKNIIVWSAQTGVPVRYLRGHGHWVNFVALNTDFVLRTGHFDHTERSFATPEAGRAYAAERFEGVVSVSQGERLVSCSDDNTMFLWAPATSDKPIARMTGHQGAVFHVAFSPDGRYIASCSADKSVKLWDARDGRFVTSFRGHVAAVYHVSWSADSRLLASGSRDTTLKLWDTKTLQLEKDMAGHNDEVFGTDWSPDGLRIATGSKDKTIRVWVH